MRLTLVRSGGFAGLRRPPCTVDTAGLAPAAARRIADQLNRADFFRLKADLGPPAGTDRFQYSLTVEHPDGRNHTVSFSEDNAHPALVELARELPGAKAT